MQFHSPYYTDERTNEGNKPELCMVPFKKTKYKSIDPHEKLEFLLLIKYIRDFHSESKRKQLHSETMLNKIR